MKSILRISDFNEIVIGLKAMKADLLCVYGQYLVGVDNTMNVVKIYSMSKVIPIEPFTIITKELSSEFYANITDTEIIIDTDECKIYCPNNKSFADSKENPMISLAATNEILIRYNKICQATFDPYFGDKVTKVFGDVTEDPGLVYIRALKASDGGYPYSPRDDIYYTMYLYNGFLPLTKADRVALSIYDQGSTFISRFTVYKKKMNPIDVYCRYIKLNG